MTKAKGFFTLVFFRWSGSILLMETPFFKRWFRPAIFKELIAIFWTVTRPTQKIALWPQLFWRGAYLEMAKLEVE